MELYYKVLGEGDPLIIVHGLFGSSDNWSTLGKKFAQNYKVYLVDQRNHGKSNHNEEHNYDSMADDLLELIYEEQLMSVNLLGHSMGGKTVMRFAEKHPELVDKMIVADIGPKEYPPHHNVILDVLLSVDPATISSRKEADEILQKQISDISIRQFLLKNLFWKEPKKLAWRMNVPVLNKNINEILAKVPNEEVDVETLFLKGEFSDYILAEDGPMIKKLFPNSEIILIKKAGHWLHAEAPKEFYTKVTEFLEGCC